MPVAVGSRVGVYEVTAQIGAGAMGVVFRARDTKLLREVALKVLPEHFATLEKGPIPIDDAVAIAKQIADALAAAAVVERIAAHGPQTPRRALGGDRLGKARPGL